LKLPDLVLLFQKKNLERPSGPLTSWNVLAWAGAALD